MRCVVTNTQMTNEEGRSRPYSEPWMTSGSDEPVNSPRSPQESSSYDDQKRTLSTLSPSTQRSTSSSPRNRPSSTHTRTPSNPSGRRTLPTTHTSSHNSEPNVTPTSPSNARIVGWDQLPRDGGGVTIGTNFHFPPSYGLPGIPEIPKNPEDEQ